MNTSASKAGFIRAIIENPEDSTARLIYADWLEENGKEDYAEFIRVQCRMADSLGLTEVQHDTLRQREKELWKEFAIPLAKEIFPNGKQYIVLGGSTLISMHVRMEYTSSNAIEVCFKRGFANSIRCNMNTLFGGQCGRCNGYGTVDQTRTTTPSELLIWTGDRALFGTFDCPTCDGTGSIEGVAESLFSKQPITELNIIDLIPRYVTRPNDNWFVNLPIIPVRRYLGLERTAITFANKCLVNHGRELAGLSPLVELT
jgi:uncharacterized protein (TIGR02996 family)